MKIDKEFVKQRGYMKAPEWAIGKEEQCVNCLAKVTLEEIDQVWTDDIRKGTSCSIRCPHCGHGMYFYKMQQTKKRPWWNVWSPPTFE